MMLTFSGCHGTTESRAASIAASGFRMSASGFWGHGVYFFHESKGGIEDAYHWYEFSHSCSPSPYCEDEDQRGVVVIAAIKVTKHQHLDLSDENFQARLEVIENARPQLTQQDLNNLRDSLITLYEEELGQQLKVCTASIPLPKRGHFFRPKKAACCIIVREDACIFRPYRVERPYGYKANSSP